MPFILMPIDYVRLIHFSEKNFSGILQGNMRGNMHACWKICSSWLNYEERSLYFETDDLRMKMFFIDKSMKKTNRKIGAKHCEM